MLVTFARTFVNLTQSHAQSCWAMNNFLMLVIFILTASAIFPLVGYYLDYRERRKQNEE